MSLGYYVTPALLGGTSNMMLAELVAQFVQSLVNWGMGGAAALVLLVVTLVLYASSSNSSTPIGRGKSCSSISKNSAACDHS